MKKFILIILITIGVYYGAKYINDNYLHDALFEGHYSKNYDINDKDTPSVWEKIKKFVSGLFEDKEKEKFIYK